jgi:hypothetical protein
MKTIFAALVAMLMLSCNEVKKKVDHQIIEVQKTIKPPTLDGIASENSWKLAKWHPLDQIWEGQPYDPSDFNGRYKLLWDNEALYVLVEISDNVLFDQNKDPLKLFWNDDCVEVFVDEDNSGGLHQFNNNAFGYHIALDGNVVDLAPDKAPHLFNDNLRCVRVTEGNVSTWEMAIKMFDSKYVLGNKNTGLKLFSGKRIGFALAYCDNDGSTIRENFIGSVFVPGEDKDQAWINADIFGTLVLKDSSL